jgi:predicted phosphodiesterase
MRIAIISDIHGNLEALQVVRQYLQENKIEEIYCLGDIVGYGANPNECLEMVAQISSLIVVGNHDHAAIGLTNVNYFNDYAKISTYWTYSVLSAANKNFISTLDFTRYRDRILLVHATPSNPSLWHYVLTEQDARNEFESFTQNVCFIGHSHLPVIFSNNLGFIKAQNYILSEQDKYIVNVGSVGQPRDGNPKTCFCVYNSDTGQLEYVRLSYDVALTQEKIVRAGLPVYLADRLLNGY